MRKVMAITGRRTEYGQVRKLLMNISEHPKLELCLVVTGNHLMEKFGSTIDQIRSDGFTVNYVIDACPKNNNGGSMAKALGKCIIGLVDVVSDAQPDIILVLTDLGHVLAGAIVGGHMNIPVAHIQGGDVSGTIDECIRHATTKFAHIHFPGSKKSAERIAKLGEELERIHLVGAPGLEEILHQEMFSKDEIYKKFKLSHNEPYFLMIQHSNITEADDAERQIKETMNAIIEKDIQTVIIYPNADAGSKDIISVINKYKHYPKIKIYKTLERKLFISLLKYCDVLVGNSSCGILEAPSLKKPVVNIGTRQNNRERAGNVIDVGYSKSEIIGGIDKSMSKEFKEVLKSVVSPYGDGNTSQRIVDVLENIKIDKKLIQKRITY